MVGTTRRLTLSIVCGDNFGAAISSQSRLAVVEGTFNIQTNGATMAVAEGTPLPGGTQLAAGTYVSLGPVTVAGSGWRLDQTYFRNTTPGSNATVVFVGTVQDA